MFRVNKLFYGMLQKTILFMKLTQTNLKHPNQYRSSRCKCLFLIIIKNSIRPTKLHTVSLYELDRSCTYLHGDTLTTNPKNRKEFKWKPYSNL